VQAPWIMVLPQSCINKNRKVHEKRINIGFEKQVILENIKPSTSFGSNNKKQVLRRDKSAED
jgi:hypothetical protein